MTRGRKPDELEALKAKIDFRVSDSEKDLYNNLSIYEKKQYKAVIRDLLFGKKFLDFVPVESIDRTLDIIDDKEILDEGVMYLWEFIELKSLQAAYYKIIRNSILDFNDLTIEFIFFDNIKQNYDNRANTRKSCSLTRDKLFLSLSLKEIIEDKLSNANERERVDWIKKNKYRLFKQQRNKESQIIEPSLDFNDIESFYEADKEFKFIIDVVKEEYKLDDPYRFISKKLVGCSKQSISSLDLSIVNLNYNLIIKLYKESRYNKSNDELVNWEVFAKKISTYMFDKYFTKDSIVKLFKVYNIGIFNLKTEESNTEVYILYDIAVAGIEKIKIEFSEIEDKKNILKINKIEII